MSRFKALCGCAAADILRRASELEIIAVHSESVYMRASDGRMFLLCPQKYGIVPFGAALYEFDRLRLEKDFFVGERATLKDRDLYFDGGYILNFDIETKEICTHASDTIPSAETLRFCAEYVAEHASARGMGPSLPAFLCISSPAESANAYALTAAAYADRFEESFERSDTQALSDTVSKFIGLGYGLTPSGDDFISGMAYAFGRFSVCSKKAGRCMRMLRTSVKDKLDRTNEISREYLLCAIGGEYFEVVENVLDAISKKKLDRAATEGAMQELLRVGASSGSDILCGILFACYILM